MSGPLRTTRPRTHKEPGFGWAGQRACRSESLFSLEPEQRGDQAPANAGASFVIIELTSCFGLTTQRRQPAAHSLPISFQFIRQRFPLAHNPPGQKQDHRQPGGNSPARPSNMVPPMKRSTAPSAQEADPRILPEGQPLFWGGRIPEWLKSFPGGKIVQRRAFHHVLPGS